MLESLAMYSDELMELLLSEEEFPRTLIHRVTRRRAAAGRHARVSGFGLRNKGVQPLLDAIVRYLPSPLEREIKRQSMGQSPEVGAAGARSRASRSWAWRSRSSTIRTAN
jgi:translation elongation factor EF-G